MPVPSELPLIPSLAQMALLGIRAEALRTVADDRKTAELSAAWDWFFARVAKRVTRPIVTFDDDEGKRVICLRASIEALKWGRGMKPEAGQDKLVADATKDMEEFIRQVRLGEIVLLLTDSTAIDDVSMKLARNEVGSDGWTKDVISPFKPWWMYP